MLSRRRIISVSAVTLGVAGHAPPSQAACRTEIIPAQWITGPPEFLPGATMRTSLAGDAAGGQRIQVVGTALTTACVPLPGARLDFWHTDSSGIYDMRGHKFLGTQLTGPDGRFQLDTVTPGPYEGNVRHVHYMLSTRLGDQPQPLVLSGAIWFPTPEEFAKDTVRAPEFLSPDSFRTVGGVLMGQCDIVLEAA